MRGEVFQQTGQLEDSMSTPPWSISPNTQQREAMLPKLTGTCGHVDRVESHPNLAILPVYVYFTCGGADTGQGRVPQPWWQCEGQGGPAHCAGGTGEAAAPNSKWKQGRDSTCHTQTLFGLRHM